MPPFTLSPAAQRWLPPFLLCLLLVPLKLATLPAPTGPFLIDGSYYYQIARHVAEGEGFKTSVSLYHEGLDPLPAPARIYPLWPLLLGTIGRATDLMTAARTIPTLLFFLDIFLLYELVRRVAVRFSHESAPAAGAALTPTLVVAAFSANFAFWFTTSEPYTEGLAFALAFGSLLVLDSAALKASPSRGAVAGMLASLAYLTRSQMLLVIVAIAFALIAAAFWGRRLGTVAFAFLSGATLTVVPWRLYLLTHPVARQDIGRFVTWIESGSLGAYLADRAPGFVVAFDPRSQLSYFNSFGVWVAAVPLAVLWLAWQARSRSVPAVVQAEWVLPATAVLIGLANHAALIHRHAQLLLPWLFGWRHGILFVFPLVIAATYLLTRPMASIRVGTAVLLVVSALSGWARIYAAPPVSRGLSPAERELVSWVAGRPDVPVLLATRAQSLGMLTRARIHWTECDEPPQQTRLMLARLPITHVVMYERDRPCSFAQGLQDVLEVDRWFGRPGEEPILLLQRRDHGRTGGERGE